MPFLTFSTERKTTSSYFLQFIFQKMQKTAKKTRSNSKFGIFYHFGLKNEKFLKNQQKLKKRNFAQKSKKDDFFRKNQKNRKKPNTKNVNKGSTF